MGCEVGIPIIMGIIISVFFWVHLRRKFKKEDESDIDLNRAVYDDDDVFINFQNGWSMQDESISKKNFDSNHTGSNGMNNNTSDVLEHGVKEDRKKRKYFIPAYKRRTLNMIFKHDELQVVSF